MGTFNQYDQENTNRRTVNALESIVAQLEQMNRELRDIKEDIRHRVKMDSIN